MPATRILITGALGYVGRHLCQALSSHNHLELHGTYRSLRPHRLNVTLAHLDLADVQATRDYIHRLQPQQIYHVAGNIHAGRTSPNDAQAAWQDNLLATLNLYDACATLTPMPHIVFVSTGAIYGQADGVITEATPLQPLSPYAASKAAADLASYQSWHTHRLPIVRARLFNYVGPGQAPGTALGHFAQQLHKLKRDGITSGVLRVGNLDAERDFTDIADVVSALMLLMGKGVSGEAYHIASGISRPMRWHLDQLIRLAEIPVQVQVDSAQVRSNEPLKLRVDISKIKQATGWQPRVAIEESLRRMMQDNI